MSPSGVLSETGALMIVTGVAWSAALALARRAVSTVEGKIDENARKVARLESKMSTMIGDTKYRIERNFRDLVEDSRADIRELSRRLDEAAAIRREEIKRLEREQAERIEMAERRLEDKLELVRAQAAPRGELQLIVSSLGGRLEAIYNQIIQHRVSE